MNLLMKNPMTKEELGRFNGRPIKFNVSGVSFLGSIHHTAMDDSFRVIYPVVEEGKARNENLPLTDCLIERIVFIEEENLLMIA